MGSARPLYPSSNDPDLRNGSPRYVAAGTNSCPPPHVLEKHFSSPTEESHPRFNVVRTQFTPPPPKPHVSVFSSFPGKRSGGFISLVVHVFFFPQSVFLSYFPRASNPRGSNIRNTIRESLSNSPHHYVPVKQNPPALLGAPERQ